MSIYDIAIFTPSDRIEFIVEANTTREAIDAAKQKTHEMGLANAIVVWALPRAEEKKCQ